MPSVGTGSGVPARGDDIPSREGEAAYDVRWPWNHGEPLRPGLTCVFRVKDEARNLPWVLPPMLEAVDHVVLVDNASRDGTAEVAARIAEEHGAADRYTGLSYPWPVARAGAEHLATAPDSVHSLTHYYNWALSHVRTSYSMKWDGDMVLTREGVGVLDDYAWQLERSGTVVAFPRHPLTVVSESEAWLDVSSRFIEPWLYPSGPGYTFVKGFEWEVREFPSSADRIIAPEGLCVELKWLDVDELAHWSELDAGATRVSRKRRELQVREALLAGRGEDVARLQRIEAPPGEHVVDHVVGPWLARSRRPVVRRPRPIGGSD